MTVERMVAERGARWRELETLLARCGERPERLGAEGVLHAGALYRGALADLARLRRLEGAANESERLQALVLRARSALYADEARRGSVAGFFATTYWRLVRRRVPALLVAAALLFGPALLAGAWAATDTGTALGIVPTQFRGAVEPTSDTGLTRGERAAFSGEVLTNNIRVTLLVFALGITAGLGTALVLVFNGATLGVIGGGAIAAGHGAGFAQFVVAHGVIELSCIIVAAAAGFGVGWALVEPGRASRSRSVAREARGAVLVVLGTAPWLVLAGFIEGFVTRAGVGLWPGVGIGVTVGVVFWGLVVVRGAPRASP